MVTVPCYHISIIALKPVNHTFGTHLQPNTLLKIEENPFLLNNKMFQLYQYYREYDLEYLTSLWPYYGIQVAII